MSAPAAPAATETPLNPVFFTPEGDLTDKFYKLLRTVFLQYAKAATEEGEAKGDSEDPDEVRAGKASMDREAMNAFSNATNGHEMPDEQWDEVVMYLDVNEANELTFKGFVGLYTLQTENDEAETVKDLKQWGYDPETLDLAGRAREPAAGGP